MSLSSPAASPAPTDLVADESPSDSLLPKLPLEKLNRLLLLANDLMDLRFHFQDEQDSGKDARADLLAILDKVFDDNTLDFTSIKEKLESQLSVLCKDEERQYSKRDIALAWRHVLKESITQCRFHKKTDQAFTTYHKAMKLLYDGDFDFVKAQEIFFSFLLQLSHQKGMETARAIHNILKVSRNLAFADQDKEQGYRRVATWCGPLLFHALDLRSIFDKKDLSKEEELFNQLCGVLLSLHEFDSVYLESYCVTQVNSILLLVHTFMDTESPNDIIRENDPKGLILQDLKEKLYPYLLLQSYHYDVFHVASKEIIMNIMKERQATTDDISMALGQYFRLSFGNSQLFVNDHKILAAFHEKLIKIYEKSEITTACQDYRVTHNIVFDSKSAVSHFKRMLESLARSSLSDDVEIAKAIHNFLVIGRKYAQCKVERKTGKGFDFAAKAGLAPALAKVLRLESKIDSQNRVYERTYFNRLCVEFLQLPQFDGLFDIQTYKKSKKLKLGGPFSRLSISGSSQPPISSPEPPSEVQSLSLGSAEDSKIPHKQLSLGDIDDAGKEEKRKTSSADVGSSASRNVFAAVRRNPPLRRRPASQRRDDVAYSSEVEPTGDRTYLPSKALSPSKERSSPDADTEINLPKRKYS